MKFFLIAAVLVASVFAEPESEAKADAKPWLAYSNLGYAGYPYAAGYSTYGAYPYATYGLGYTGYAGHLVGKRSADAESDAKPWLTYANYGYAGYPYASTYGAYAYPSAVYSHAAYAAPVATYAGAHFIGKREAEAESDAKPWLTYANYGNYGYAGYPYASTYGAYAYPSAVYSHAAYAAPVATYAGAHFIGKREAEAEPESWYGAYGYSRPYGYSTYGAYGGYAAYRPYTYGRVYGGYGYGWWTLEK